jgi:transcriptional regulator
LPFPTLSFALLAQIATWPAHLEQLRCVVFAGSYTSNVDGTGTMPRAPTIDLLQGTLDLLILKTLSWGPAHGYAVARWIQQLTGEVLTVGEGSLYPALHRLEEREWIESDWQLSEHNRRAKFYRLTTRGRQQLRTETATWGQFVAAVAKVLDATEQPA